MLFAIQYNIGNEAKTVALIVISNSIYCLFTLVGKGCN